MTMKEMGKKRRKEKEDCGKIYEEERKKEGY